MVVAIDSATKQNAGSWELVDATKTQIIDGEAPLQTRKYITHKTAGTIPDLERPPQGEYELRESL